VPQRKKTREDRAARSLKKLEVGIRSSSAWNANGPKKREPEFSGDGTKKEKNELSGLPTWSPTGNTAAIRKSSRCIRKKGKKTRMGGTRDHQKGKNVSAISSHV